MKSQKQQGFTIIEVVLVLAIAGLIFLVVFLAVPALQRSQRDTARKNDLSRFMSQISSYQSNNKGTVPVASAAGVSAFVAAYLTPAGDTFEDPSGGDYTYVYGVGAGPTTRGQIRYATAATCGANGDVVAATGQTRKVAASVALEGGGAYCQNS